MFLTTANKAIRSTLSRRNFPRKNHFATGCPAFHQTLLQTGKNRDFYAPFLPNNLSNFFLNQGANLPMRRATSAVQPV